MLVSCQQNIDKVINGVHFYTIDNPEHEILITSFSRKGELIVIKASKVKRRLEKLEELAKYYGFNNYNEFIVESIKIINHIRGKKLCLGNFPGFRVLTKNLAMYRVIV